MQGIAGVLPRTSDDEDSAATGEARGARAIAELVLPALLAALVQRPELAGVIGCEAPDVPEPTPDGWRSSASTLTAERIAPSDAVESTPEGSSMQGEGTADRLVARVDGGELGSIRLVVERTSEGITVEVAADSAETAARAELERASLEQALRAVGLPLASVTIVNSGGADIAHSVGAGADVLTRHLNVFDTASEETHAEGAPKAGRLPRRLNVTG